MLLGPKNCNCDLEVLFAVAEPFRNVLSLIKPNSVMTYL